eukprot:31927_1
MSSSYVLMQDEYAKLKSLGRETVSDWVLHPKFGFFASNGYYVNQTGYYNEIKMLTGGEQCQINYISVFDNYIRFPFNGLLTLIGITIGLIGFLKFRKHSARISLSFVFFMCMNISGLFFHSLLPISSKYRIFFALIDKASTGVSGTFLSLELLSIIKKNSKSRNKDLSITSILYMLAIVFVEFLISNIPIIAEWIYIWGCVSVFGVCMYILYKKRNINKILITMSRYCMILLCVLGVALPFWGIICESTMSVVNLMSLLFGICDVGFGMILFFMLKYFQIPRKNKKKNKKKNR